VPTAGAILLLFVPRRHDLLLRAGALLVTIVTFALSVPLYLRFDAGMADYQFVEFARWMPNLGVGYHVGIDGISLLLILLTTFLSFLCVLFSFNIKKRVKEYMIFLLVLETAMTGVFCALDLVLFYVFWEAVLIPMYFLIGIWGHERRIYAAIKFFLYTFAASVLMLVAIVFLYSKTGSFNLVDLLTPTTAAHAALGGIDANALKFLFLAFALAFMVKVPMFPFHTWLPDAHVEAPTAASVILAAVMLKMGGYGMLRFNLPLFPEGSEDWALVIVILSVIAVIYGALVALVQPDMKKLIAYSSVSHMGFVTLGIFVPLLILKADRAAGTVQNVDHYLNGMNGAMMVMLAHGFNTGGLFLCVGVIYERAHTRLISRFGGLASRMPVYSTMFALFMLASIGLPGLSGFVGEFLVALATFQWNKWVAFITFSVVIFAAWYMMWLYQRVIFGRQPQDMPDPGDTELTPEEVAMLAAQGGGQGSHGHGDLLPVSGASHEHDEHEEIAYPDATRRELLTLMPLAALTIFFGVYPKPIFDIVGPTFERILQPFLS
jgi:NADH-quinone oxidoreductase subunit M